MWLPSYKYLGVAEYNNKNIYTVLYHPDSSKGVRYITDLIFDQVFPSIIETPERVFYNTSVLLRNMVLLSDSCGSYKNAKGLQDVNVSINFPNSKKLISISSETKRVPLRFDCENFQFNISFAETISIESVSFCFYDNQQEPTNLGDVEISSIPSLSEFEFLGCFADNTSERDLPFYRGTFANNNPKLCAQFCKGFAFMSLQWGFECWCGNSYGKYSQLQNEHCHVCPGNSSFSCGSDIVGSVYKLKYLAPILEKTLQNCIIFWIKSLTFQLNFVWKKPIILNEITVWQSNENPIL